jgi:hypothetical protein
MKKSGDFLTTTLNIWTANLKLDVTKNKQLEEIRSLSQFIVFSCSFSPTINTSQDFRKCVKQFLKKSFFFSYFS